ncbi:MAG: hypothetical protein K0B05_10890 [Bacteroidales bacterium]|nr:hypothetical protein [Bacteroidales bacterium]
MSRLILNTFILILQSCILFAQPAENLPSVDKNDLPEADFSSARTFSGTALYGYINGGADLYLEYGFIAAQVTEINYRGGNYKTAIYRMTDPEAAFGIYSVSRFKCAQKPAVSDFTCQTGYHLQFCRGSYYVSIINGRGSGEDKDASLEIAKIIAGKIREPVLDLTSYLPGTSKEEIQNNCFLARGRLGVVNGSPDLEDFFKGISGYTAVILEDEEKTVISVKCSTEELCREFPGFLKNDKEVLPGTGLTLHPDDLRKISDNHLYIVLRRKI